MERLENPYKNWKLSSTDAKERGHWDAYMEACEDTIRNTATKEAPWYVVPADNKWFSRVVVAAALIEALDSLDLRYPRMDEAKLKDLEAARKTLLEQKSQGRLAPPDKEFRHAHPVSVKPPSQRLCGGHSPRGSPPSPGVPERAGGGPRVAPGHLP